MEHQGQERLCCGSGAICRFPDSCAQIRKDRLYDAVKTGAKRLLHLSFKEPQVWLGLMLRSFSIKLCFLLNRIGGFGHSLYYFRQIEEQVIFFDGFPIRRQPKDKGVSVGLYDRLLFVC